MAEIARNGPRHRFTWLRLPLASQGRRNARWSRVKCGPVTLANCAVALCVDGRTSGSEPGTSGSPRALAGNV